MFHSLWSDSVAANSPGSLPTLMTSLMRPLLTSVLVAMIVVGHAPAWLHVATCDSHQHAGGHQHAVTKSHHAGDGGVHPDDRAHSHDHCHGCDGDAASADSLAGRSPSAHDSEPHDSGPHDSGPHDPSHHDSDSCHVCHSLVAPGGFAEATMDVGVVAPVCDTVASASPSFDVRSILSLPPLRGPPVENEAPRV